MTTAALSGTTYDSRAYAPYIKVAFPAQSMTIGTSLGVGISAPYYIAGGASPVWTMTAIAGLTINSSTGLITGTVTMGAVTSFQITCTNAVGAISSAAAIWTVIDPTPSWITNPPATITFVDGSTNDFAFASYLNTTNAVVVALDPASTEANKIPATLPSQLTLPAVTPPVLRFTNTAGSDLYGPVNFKWGAQSLESLAELDWQSRIAGQGVVWYHDFRTTTEVGKFRTESGTAASDPGDLVMPGYCAKDTTDGIQGYCLAINRDAGTNDPPTFWRWLAPVDGTSNGRGVADPGAASFVYPTTGIYAGTAASGQSGAVTVRSWNPTQGSTAPLANKCAAGVGGWYGHPDYWAASPGSFDGFDFYIQFRAKISASRFLLTNPYGGKLTFLSVTAHSGLNQATLIVPNYYLKTDTVAYPRMYSHWPDQSSWPSNWTADGNHTQPGGAADALYPNFDSPLYRYGHRWRPDEWVTILVHVVPSHHGVTDGRYESWYWHPGESGYTKWYDLTLGWYYDYQGNPDPGNSVAGVQKGWNSYILSAYMNGAQQSMATSLFHKFDQIIFSKAMIPCPTV